MFYSQFILAKKGPLGTIWIAAHLERKLRKNQVADTDIGLSVDSILFPEVPIALRLSSHLLLGVVRIYSRKVNYLFDDCSEALLKIKQAFRSTAVDLPPEESTAPYHSITLPETFDLDDFELPDNDIYQGNYVDHHISSRDQITLQDTMEGVVYTSSQFGLDERFGDGETSGLDLDEELFLDKVAAAGRTSILTSSDADPQTSVQPMAPLKQDENHEEMILDQIEGVDGDADFIEDAHAPCTPGLVEEPNLSNIQETSACEDNLESEDHNLPEVAARENLENASSELDRHHNKDLLDGSFPSDMHPGSILCMPVEENVAGAQDTKLPEERACSTADEVGVSSVSELSDRIVGSPDGPGRDIDLGNGIFRSDEPVSHSKDGSCEDCVEPQAVRLETNSTITHQPVSKGVSENDQASLNLEKSCTSSDMWVSNCKSHARTDLENPQTQAEEPKDSNNLDCFVIEDMTCSDVQILHQCNTDLNQHTGVGNSVHPELPSEIYVSSSLERSQKDEALHTSGISIVVKGEGPAAIDGSQVLEENCITEPASFEVVQAVCSKSNDQVENVVSGDSQLENLNSSADSDVPAPEKLLSVPEGITDLPGAFLLKNTPEQGLLLEGNGGGNGSQIISGKKRSFTESTLTVQSLESVESLGVVRSKRTTESVPDDDDLLSSILVGRRSSVLKVKPTPPPEVTSMKRLRSAPRISASKRKVLMDETMVLHGDTIRQQLINSEDIRRVRKKAPCTRPEILMIQKQFLEDEIFNESIISGLSVEMVSLHNQTYDLREIRVSQNDSNSTSSESAADVKTSLDDGNTAYVEATYDKHLSVRPNDTIGTGEADRGELLAITENGEARPFETPLLNENRREEGHALTLDTCTRVQEKPTSDEVAVMTPCYELLGEIADMEIDGRCEASVDAVNPVVESLNPTDEVLYDSNDLSLGMVQLVSLDITGAADASVQMDALVASSNQKLGLLPSKIDGSLMDMNVGNVHTNEIADKKDDNITAVEADSKTRDGILLEENGGNASFDISKDIHRESSTHKSSNPSTFSLEAGECSTQVISTNQAMEEIRKDVQGVVNYDEALDAEVGCNCKNLIANGVYGEEPSHPSEVNVDANSVLLNSVENPGGACPLGVTDTEFSSIDRVDPDDFDYSVVGHDTEFLNVDDDEVAEADDSCVPNSEETCFLDNSGWSSRTRAVAKYLQTLFDKEAEHGRKVLPMDNLLARKTRKEASRMFFEALVLKTRDYIHVEQEKPFGNINMKPRIKLLKSEY